MAIGADHPFYGHLNADDRRKVEIIERMIAWRDKQVREAVRVPDYYMAEMGALRFALAAIAKTKTKQ